MTGRERLLAVLSGQEADHLPLMPITMMFAANALGVKYEQYARDYRAMADAQIKVAQMYGFDHVSAIGPPAPETTDLGAAIRWYPDQPPATVETNSLLFEKRDLGPLCARGPIVGERVENRIRGIERMRTGAGQELLVEGWVSGPCAAAADMRGINRLMLDFADDPAFVRELLEFAVEVGMRFAGLQMEAGADSIGIGDASASLVGPRIYKEFVWPSEKKLVDFIHSQGAKVRLHICGNTRRILEPIEMLGCDLVDIDFLVPLKEAREKMGPDQALSGNLDPVRVIRDGSPVAVTNALEALHAAAGRRWVVAAGCEIPRQTPPENLRAMTTFAQTHAGRDPAFDS